MCRTATLFHSAYKPCDRNKVQSRQELISAYGGGMGENKAIPLQRASTHLGTSLADLVTFASTVFEILA